MSGHIRHHLERAFTRSPWRSIFILTACFFVLFQFCLILYGVDFARQSTLEGWTDISMLAYLKGDLSPDALRDLEYRIKAIDGVSGVEFVSSSQGLDRMKEWLGRDNPLVEDLAPGVLPDAFDIECSKQAMPKTLAGEISGFPAVADVRWNRGMSTAIAHSYPVIFWAGAFVFMLSVISLGLVIFLSMRNNMIVYARENRILTFLGADKGFIFAPHLIEVSLYVLVASVLSIVAANGVIMYVHGHAPVFAGCPASIGWNLAGQVIGFSFVIGFFSTFLAIRDSSGV